MEKIPKKLQQVINYIEETHQIDKSEIVKLQNAYNFARETFLQFVTEESDANSQLDHSMTVAQFIASWQFDSSVVLASMLHDFPVYYAKSLENIKMSFGEITYNILVDYSSIYNQFRYHETNNSATNLDDLLSILQGTHSSAFYIFIAKRIDL